MTSSAKKQPTISKFFASVKQKRVSDIQTDVEMENTTRNSEKVCEVSVTTGVKRQTSQDSHNDVSPHQNKKKSRKDENGCVKSASPKIKNESHVKRSVVPWTMNRLQAFSADLENSQEEMECFAEEAELKPSKNSSPSKSINQASVKSKLGGFRSPSSKDTKANNSDQEEEEAGKNHPLKPLPGLKLTPLEQQVVALKKKYLDTILFVECGYKYRFFGHDAEIAAKELNIVAHLDHSFMTASIPTYRLHVHVRRLVANGYKVGVIKQTETAAIKAAGSNKNAPFVRELSALYTRSTLIGEDVNPSGSADDVSGGDEISESTTAMLLVLHEEKSPSGKEGAMIISVVAIQPSTGDIIYDTFEDSPTRTELWNRIDHIQPVEALVAQCTSDLTVQTISAATTKRDDRIRIEKISESKYDYAESLKRLCNLLEGEEDRVKHVSGLPPNVICCLGATLDYLAEFKLDRIIKMAGSVQPFSMKHHYMRLSGATLRNLEVLANGVNGDVKGSLFWALDKTLTRFGSRLLRRWIIQPLLNIKDITERQDMIEEIMTSDSAVFSTLRTVLYKLPDFERAITTIFHKKCSPHEFWIALNGLNRVHAELLKVSGNLHENVQAPALKHLLQEVLEGLSNIREYADNIDEASAKEGKKTTLFRDFSKFPEVLAKMESISEVEQELKGLKPEICKVLRLPAFNYTTVSGLEYLVEVKNAQLKAVPKNWNKINTTKACCRFRPPEVEKSFSKLQILREELQAVCHQ
ncbi:Mismatch repair protein msh3, partial [Halocaridina rubra]